MTHPLIGQRSRSELIAELYERHAAGLFAYCHDQLGESGSAADALVAVLTSVPNAEPPRAALYALARREIYRRDVSYAMPSVDSAADPVTALIERVFRDIRPHQREVLLLSAVCGLTEDELSWVLDVAPDTATELVESARHRFHQTLSTAVAAARTAPFVAPAVTEIFDAIGVAPIEDVLARLPWRRPAHAVRARVLVSLPFDEVGRAIKLPVRRLWPTTPSWPLPLSSPDQVSNAVVVPTGSLPAPPPVFDAPPPVAPDPVALRPDSVRRAKHEATTQPMPRLRGLIPSSLADVSLIRRKPKPAPAPEPPPTQEEPAFDYFTPPPHAPAETTGPIEKIEAPEPAEDFDAFKPAAAEETPEKAEKIKRVRMGEHHYDWLWELVGFLICLAIALAVFFTVPTIVTP
ncbi:hypothetical protein J5X84_10005 [Streptosporangiaceae bacterium NEAU-GS5]|nr:hypothetical protein [Streptosporangiaceae bacterium NEAU-GS5]